MPTLRVVRECPSIIGSDKNHPDHRRAEEDKVHRIDQFNVPLRELPQ
jgi:hypothetical protein